MKRLRKKTLTRAAVREWLQSRHWLRLHMFVIVAVTFGAGLVATWALMKLGVDRLWWRYAIGVCAAYLVFLALVRLWIWFVCRIDAGYADGEAFELVLRNAERIEWTTELGGGGEFGGGGASGGWEGGEDVVAAPMKVASSSDGGGLSLDVGDAEGCAGVIVLGVLVALFMVVGGYLIYTAPAILAEAAFEALLAAALARRAKRVAGAGWVGSVFLSTFWVFAAVLAFAIVLGWYAQMRCPEAMRLRDAVNCGPTRR